MRMFSGEAFVLILQTAKGCKIVSAIATNHCYYRRRHPGYLNSLKTSENICFFKSPTLGGKIEIYYFTSFQGQHRGMKFYKLFARAFSRCDTARVTHAIENATHEVDSS